MARCKKSGLDTYFDSSDIIISILRLIMNTFILIVVRAEAVKEPNFILIWILSHGNLLEYIHLLQNIMYLYVFIKYIPV